MKSLSRKDRARSKLRTFSQATSGATALEYAVIAAFLSVAIVVSVQNVGVTVRDDLFVRVQNALARAIRNEPPVRALVQDQEADPIVTGSTPDK